jgi:potassium efflux system protein
MILGRSQQACVAAVLSFLPAFLSIAQEENAEPPALEPSAAPNDDQIQQRISDIEVDDSLAAEDRNRAIAELQSASGFLAKAQSERAEADRFVQEARAAPGLLAQVEARLRMPPMPARVSPDADIDDLLADLSDARSRLEELERERRASEAAESESRRNRERIGPRRTEVQQRLDEVRARLRSGADPSDHPVVAEARRMRLEAEQAALEAEQDRLDKELRSYDARRELLEKRKIESDLQLAMARNAITALEQAITRLRAAEAEAALADAREELADAEGAHELVVEIYERNVALSESLAEIANALIDLAAERAAIDSITNDIRARFAESRERIADVGLTEAIGLHLRNQRARLPDMLEHERRRRELQERMNEAQRDMSDAEYRLEELEDPAAVIAERMARHAQVHDPLPPDAHEDVSSDMDDAFYSQQEDLRDLVIAYNDYSDALLEVDNAEKRLIDQARAYRTFIDERILWIQSAEPLSTADFPRTWLAIQWLFDTHWWMDILSLLWADIRAEPVTYAAWLLLLLALIVIYPRLRKGLEQIAGKTARSRTDRFGLTVQATLYSVLMSALLPLLLAVVGTRLYSAAAASELAAAVSVGLRRAAVMLFATELLRNLCRPHGLGESHFDWRSANLKTVRANLRWLAPVIIPVVFIVAVTDVNEEHRDSLGRLAFIAGMVAVAAFIFRVFHPTRGILREFIARHRDGWIEHLKYLWFGGFAIAPFALAVTAALGWFYTAVQLERLMVQTTYLILIVIVAQAFLLRWLFIAQRKMAVEQARKKLAAARAEAEDKAAQATIDTAGAPPPAPAAPEGQSVPESVDIDVAAVSAQTRKLLNTMVAFAIAIGVVLVWVDVMPAFSIFREVVLWHESAPEGSSSVTALGLPTAPSDSDAATGGSSPASDAPAVAADEGTAITLAHLMYAFVVLAITVAVSKNIPGVLEITLLQRLPITPGGRYAFTTIARYAIVIVGTVLAFNAIGIGWSKVQWLAAAITVGLGFGLQEIFANFVSGLIILFERPIRVGDTITVGGLNGTVARIRMRATTIVDQDRKELIIPNREFVTGQVINWTLTDSVLRVVVPVGIAYGSDVDLARRTLLQVAKAHPHVLEEPVPRALFLGFGDSALNLELRVFVPHIDYFITVRDELHAAIDAAFRKARIEIPFPQRDVHVRTLPEAIDLPAPSEEGRRPRS